MEDLVTRQQTPQLRHARSVLAALSRVGGWDGLPAAEALDTLDWVHPPHPPVVELPADDVVSEQDGLDALAAAALVAVDPEEASRVALAAESLRTPVVR